MRTVAIVQARMGSTRLPGKVLRPLLGAPMLQRQLERLRRSARLDDIVIATSTRIEDDALEQFAINQGVQVVRGSENDVLQRFLLAAHASRAELIVRITADCPMIDGAVVDRVIEVAQSASSEVDFVSNTLQRSFPRGLDTEVFFLDVLMRLDRCASSAPAREHVTYHLYQEAAALYRTRQVVAEKNHSNLRWTVDTEDDFAFVLAAYEKFSLHEKFPRYEALVEEIAADQRLCGLNAHVAQRSS